MQLISVKKLCSPTLGFQENVTITLDNGRIEKIAASKKSKTRKAEIKDFSRYNLYPGFIEAHSHITVVGDGVGDVGRDSNEYSEMIAPHLDVIDSINLDSSESETACREGIVAAAILPGSSNLIGGMGVLLSTTYHGLITEDAVIRKEIGLKMALGENPKRIFSAKNKLHTRMGAAAHIRQYFHEVENYRRKSEKEYNRKYETGVRLLQREFPARFHAHQANDIQTALRLAHEFDFDIVIEHCTDGDKIVEYLARQNVPVVVGPICHPASKSETRNRGAGAPKILQAAGLTTAITTDAPVNNIIWLRHMAGMVIKEGMEYLAALKTITCNAAMICGVADSYGDIREKMEAHLVVWDGDPLRDMQAAVVAIIDKEKIWEL